jgi:hypothetical protein
MVQDKVKRQENKEWGIKVSKKKIKGEKHTTE